MKDGTRIAVRLWLPDGAEQKPVPVVMEYISYGRMKQAHGARILPPFGIAYARPDMRGTGDSEGVMHDEYLQQEQDDGVEIIAWLAKQPWCNGSVGMRGISWGGEATLQVAAMAPPALKAIMPFAATVNRYTDDAHFIGGALSRDNVQWGAWFTRYLATPPDPKFVGEHRWRNLWMQRLRSISPVVAGWLRHQRYDAFWLLSSVEVDYARIRCPVYAVVGQLDAYRNFLPQLLSNLQVPRKGMMGPWGHDYPNDELTAGPGLEWAVEEVRWWTHWLKGEDTGIMEEPMLRVYMNSQTAPEVWPKDVPGRWVADDRWPSPSVRARKFFLNTDGLGDTPASAAIRHCRSQESVGVTLPVWMVFTGPYDLAREQTPDDKRSLTFDSDPLADDLEILGNPAARIRVSSDQPVAKVAIRVNEVTPDGKSWNVTFGLLNLTHRNGHEHPAPLEPGQDYDVEVSCYFTAHRFRKGNRIRVAVTESLWPIVWPSPRPVALSIVTGSSYLTLPVRSPAAAGPPLQVPLIRDRVPRQIEPAARAPDPPAPDAQGRVTVGFDWEPGEGWSASIREGDPNSCVWKQSQRYVLFEGAAAPVKLEVSIEFASTAEDFLFKQSLRATEGERTVLERQWKEVVKRDLM